MKACRNQKPRSIQLDYAFSIKKKYCVLAISIFLLLSLGLFFMTIGIADTNINQVISAIWAWITGEIERGPNASNYKIIVLMRFPRIVMAIVAGTGLSVAGVAMQSITKNPLVSPFTIGISSAAAFGASMCLVFGTGAFLGRDSGVVFCAFLSAFLCAALVYMVAKKIGMNPESIVLTGIALNYLFNALTSTIEFFAQEHKLAAVVQWTFGTLNGTKWNETMIAGAVVILCTGFVMRFSLMLNAMAAGEEEFIKSLGIHTEFVRTLVGILAVFMTASVISFTGVIGFVGLVAPHMARILVGNDHRFLIPFSAVIGSILLMVSDTVGKVILSPVSIPVGIVVSFLGVPLFIHLIIKKRRREAL